MLQALNQIQGNQIITIVLLLFNILFEIVVDKRNVCCVYVVQMYLFVIVTSQLLYTRTHVAM